MSSISDSAYLGNSYGQTYNSAGQFDIVSTSNLKVAGDVSVGGKINGAMKTGFVTGYISGSVLEELTVDGGSSNNSRAFRTTSGAADLPTSLYADLTDAQKGSLLTLPLGAIPTSAILCTTDTTTDPFTTGAELSVSLTNNYDPNDPSDPASGGGNATTELGSIYTEITGSVLNDTISVSSSATGPLVVNVPVESMGLNLSGGSGSCGGLTGGDDGVNTVVASVDTAIFTAAAELKIRINYVIAPTSTEFLNDNY